MSGPWYTSPMDTPGGGYGEMVDPVCLSGVSNCNYLKPDTNLAVQAGTPITSLTSGIVTDVHDYGICCGGLSTTVKMDNPPNSLAQYVSYNFLGSSNAYVGQRVNTGQQIGKAGSPYGINFALALSADPHWGGPNFHYNAVGDPRLDPRQLLSTARGGTGLSSPPDNSNSPSFITGLTEHIFVFLIALVLIVVGFVIIARPAAEAGAERGAFL